MASVGSGHEGSRVYLEVCNIALILACSRTSVCIGFVVGPSTITGVKHRGNIAIFKTHTA